MFWPLSLVAHDFRYFRNFKILSQELYIFRTMYLELLLAAAFREF